MRYVLTLDALTHFALRVGNNMGEEEIAVFISPRPSTTVSLPSAIKVLTTQLKPHIP